MVRAQLAAHLVARRSRREHCFVEAGGNDCSGNPGRHELEQPLDQHGHAGGLFEESGRAERVGLSRADDLVDQRRGKLFQRLDVDSAVLGREHGLLVVLEMDDVRARMCTHEVDRELAHELTRRERVDEIGAPSVGKP